MQWWQHTVIYQVYVRSFFDSNGDGIGDIPGITAKLDYLEALGVETLWVTPFFSSPHRDFGYDVSDYRTVSSVYGSMDDVRTLIREVHRRGMRIILDMVLNHTSIDHPWFRESRRSRDNPKRDWYVWRPGRKSHGKKPPNNWRSMVYGSGWHYDPMTEEWYWAAFLPFQSDLNWRNLEVRKEMRSMLTSWLEEGIDGFRLDIFDCIFEDPQWRDNPFSPHLLPKLDQGISTFQRVDRIRHLDETFLLAEELRGLADSYGGFLVGEVFGDWPVLRRYCGTSSCSGLHLVFLFQSLDAPFTARGFRRLLEQAEAWFPHPWSPVWVFGNHDRQRRMKTLKGSVEKAKLQAAFQLSARGVPCIYYGEEIGMGHGTIPVGESRDAAARLFTDRFPHFLVSLIDRMTGGAVHRDNCRTPMQWDDTAHAGFCSADASPWLPVQADASFVHTAAQLSDSQSLLNWYRKLLALRREYPPLTRGSLEIVRIPAHDRDILGYIRSAGEQAVLVLLNFSSRKISDIPLRYGNRHFTTLLLATGGGHLDPRSVQLDPWEACIFMEERLQK